jgi:hypothetical protein
MVIGLTALVALAVASGLPPLRPRRSAPIRPGIVRLGHASIYATFGGRRIPGLSGVPGARPEFDVVATADDCIMRAIRFRPVGESFSPETVEAGIPGIREGREVAYGS